MEEGFRRLEHHDAKILIFENSAWFLQIELHVMMNQR